MKGCPKMIMSIEALAAVDPQKGNLVQANCRQMMTMSMNFQRKTRALMRRPL
jgi:hypothetical protein